MAQAPALIAASHGTSDEAGRRAVASLVAAVAESRGDIVVRGTFVDVQQPDVPTVLGALEPGSPAVVVPLLLSAGYHVHVDLTQAAEAAQGAAPPRPVVVAAALGPDRRLAEVLARRLRASGLRGDDAIVLAAAGSSDDSAVRDCRTMADLLAEALGRSVHIGFLSAASPRLPDAVSHARALSPKARVVVASYLLAPGFFLDTARDSGADVVTAALLIDGEAPPSEIVDIVADRYDAAAEALKG
jgi:sirohydrochlorin ferrochelatase